MIEIECLSGRKAYNQKCSLEENGIDVPNLSQLDDTIQTFSHIFELRNNSRFTSISSVTIFRKHVLRPSSIHQVFQVSSLHIASVPEIFVAE